jgi:hypothetical protein
MMMKDYKDENVTNTQPSDQQDNTMGGSGNVALIDNFVPLGKMFVRLALNPQDIPPADETDKAKELLAQAGMDVSHLQKVVFIEDTEDTMHFVVRKGSSIKEEIERLQKDEGLYAFPGDLTQLYRDFFNNPEDYKGPGQNAIQKRMNLFFARIGDYSTNSCK